MTEDRIKFCAEIMSAARKCRIGLSHYENKRFAWVDPVVGVFIEGPAHEDRNEALHLACESLVNYLNKPHP